METSAKLQELVKDLDDVVNMHRELNNLFRGGCCFAASVIAEQCEKNNIPYKVLAYTDEWYSSYIKTKKQTRTLNDIAKACELAHVAIDIDGTIIGGEVKSNWTNLVKEYHDNISSETLKEIYDNNIWNSAYNHCMNDDIKHDIEMVFSMF